MTSSSVLAYASKMAIYNVDEIGPGHDIILLSLLFANICLVHLACCFLGAFVVIMS